MKKTNKLIQPEDRYHQMRINVSWVFRRLRDSEIDRERIPPVPTNLINTGSYAVIRTSVATPLRRKFAKYT